MTDNSKPKSNTSNSPKPKSSPKPSQEKPKDNGVRNIPRNLDEYSEKNVNIQTI